jgi:hypothetical protein
MIPKGLPAPLPAGERILWQGAPQTRPFLKQIFYTRAVMAYVGILLAWCLVSGAQSGNVAGALLACAKFGGLAGGAVALLAGLAWLLARSTTYTITTQRLIIEYGAAMEKTVQIPFASIASADFAAQPDGTGDIVFTLVPGQKINYIMLWPHVRPWHMTTAEPSLRAIADASAVANTLSRALAAAAGTAPVPLRDVTPSAHAETVRAAA